MTRRRVSDSTRSIFDFYGQSEVENAFVVSSELPDMPPFSALNPSYFTSGLAPPVETYERMVGVDDSGLLQDKGKAISGLLETRPRDVPWPYFNSFSPSDDIADPSSSLSSSSFADSVDFVSPVSDIVMQETPFCGDEIAPELGSRKGKFRVKPPNIPRSFPSMSVQRIARWPIDLDNSPNDGYFEPPNQSAYSTTCPDHPDYGECDGAHVDDEKQSPLRVRSFSASSSQFSSISLTRTGISPVAVSQPIRSSCKLLGQRCLEMGYVLDVEESAAANIPDENGNHEPLVKVSATITPYAYARDRANIVISDSYTHEVTPPSPNYFENRLPYEIKLEIFQRLLHLHEIDQEHAITASDWTISKACSQENRWTGRSKGFAELVRLSRVCKSWQRLAFDGHLWVHLSLREFPQLPQTFLLRLVALSGPFVRRVDLGGHSQLTSNTVMNISSALFMRDRYPERPFQRTQLTEINLSGCSTLTAWALDRIIEHSPALLKVGLKGLSAVTNATCQNLATCCPYIFSLDVSGCRNMDADGLMSFITNNRENGSILPLKELRVSGLRRVSGDLLAALGRYCPALEILILSRIYELNDSAIEAFVSSAETTGISATVELSSREGGSDASDSSTIKRRLTKLRHLSLSYCPLLSDLACLHLAHAVPKLEYLELAGIGSELKDRGLVHMLATTPFIRKLDLDEASEISDSVLQALTPPYVPEGQPTLPVVVPGSQLEQLNLSYAMRLSNDALLMLIRTCTRLKKLEVDNTRISGVTVKEFVRLARKRQATDAEIAINDCRGVGENAIRDLAALTRTRKGWRNWDARHLHYLDARDDEGLGVGEDECDEYRVALKSFYTWQVVDAVEAARDRQRKVRAERTLSIDNDKDFLHGKRSPSSWWSSARQSSGRISPSFERESCLIM